MEVKMDWNELLQFTMELRLDQAYISISTITNDDNLILVEVYNIFINECEKIIAETNYYTDI